MSELYQVKAKRLWESGVEGGEEMVKKVSSRSRTVMWEMKRESERVEYKSCRNSCYINNSEVLD